MEQLGYLALVNARYEIGRQTCGGVLLVPTGVHHGRLGGLKIVYDPHQSPPTLISNKLSPFILAKVANLLSLTVFPSPISNKAINFL